MTHEIALPVDEIRAETLLPERVADGSDIGVNYADAMLKPLKLTLEDGRKVHAKRKGLRLTITIGDRTGSALLRRLDHGPDVRRIFEVALSEAVADAGATLVRDAAGWRLRLG